MFAALTSIRGLFGEMFIIFSKISLQLFIKIISKIKLYKIKSLKSQKDYSNTFELFLHASFHSFSLLFNFVLQILVLATLACYIL